MWNLEHHLYSATGPSPNFTSCHQLIGSVLALVVLAQRPDLIRLPGMLSGVVWSVFGAHVSGCGALAGVLIIEPIQCVILGRARLAS